MESTQVIEVNNIKVAFKFEESEKSERQLWGIDIEATKTANNIKDSEEFAALLFKAMGEQMFEKVASATNAALRAQQLVTEKDDKGKVKQLDTLSKEEKFEQCRQYAIDGAWGESKVSQVSKLQSKIQKLQQLGALVASGKATPQQIAEFMALVAAQ